MARVKHEYVTLLDTPNMQKVQVLLDGNREEYIVYKESYREYVACRFCRYTNNYTNGYTNGYVLGKIEKSGKEWIVNSHSQLMGKITTLLPEGSFTHISEAKQYLQKCINASTTPQITREYTREEIHEKLAALQERLNSVPILPSIPWESNVAVMCTINKDAYCYNINDARFGLITIYPVEYCGLKGDVCALPFNEDESIVHYYFQRAGTRNWQPIHREAWVKYELVTNE
jgi:hypothetical protein